MQEEDTEFWKYVVYSMLLSISIAAISLPALDDKFFPSHKNLGLEQHDKDK